MQIGVEIDSKPRSSLAEVLRSRRDEIERRWLEAVGSAAGHEPVSARTTDLRKAIGQYLDGLAAALAGPARSDPSARIAWSATAREHALQAVKRSFDLSQLVHELFLLRKVLVEVAREEGVIAGDGDGDRLLALLDASVLSSVQIHADGGDYGTRRAEAEHIGFLTHELRNPLTTAMAITSQLRRSGGDATYLQNGLELLDRSLRRIENLIESALLTETLAIGTVKAHPADVGLKQLIEDALRGARFEAERRGLDLRATIEQDAHVQVDAGLALSALQNVFDNAVKFTDEGVVEVWAEDRPREVIIHVWDDCQGLSEDDLRTIFLPFRRGHSGKPGSGLGLAIARQALELQGGRIDAESSGEGCHFWITLPKVIQ